MEILFRGHKFADSAPLALIDPNNGDDLRRIPYARLLEKLGDVNFHGKPVPAKYLDEALAEVS